MENEPIRIMSVLPVEATTVKPSLPELNSLRLYQVLGNGVIKENAGIKYSHHDSIVYDVSTSSDELHEYYKEYIREIEVKKIVREKDFLGKPVYKEDKKTIEGKITTLLSLTGVYPSLSKEDRMSLGHNFVNVISSESGLKVIPIIRQSQVKSGETYLNIDNVNISQELFESIKGDITELQQMDNGLYSMTGYTEDAKELK